MPEFEPLTGEERELESGPETELAGVPGRRWPWQLGLVGLLLAAGVTVIMQRSAEPAPDIDRPPPPAVTTPPPQPSLPPLPTVPSPLRLVEHPVTLDLPGDVTHFDVGPDGYAAVIAIACNTLSDCTASLGVRDDYEHWVRRRLPKGIGESPSLWSLGHGVLVVEQATDRPPDRRRWRSGDGGLSWREVPTAPAEPVEDATDGTLIVTTEEYGPGCSGRRLSVLGLDGRTAPLRRPPESMLPCDALAYPDPAGRLWVAGVEPSTRRGVVALSWDGGATWRTSVLHSRLDAEFVWLSVAGTDVYATVFGPLHTSPERFGVLAVFWYDFAAWRRIARYEDPSRELNGMIACPDGMLLAIQQQLQASDREHQMISYDRGDSWAIAHTRDLVTTARPSGSPYADHAFYGWWYAPAGSQGVVRSTDCLTWHTLGVR